MSGTRLQRSTFAVLSVIGQQLLDIGHPSESVRVLEAALRLPHAGTDHQRVLACVLSTLAAACWALDRFHASIVYSLRAIAVANTQRNCSLLLLNVRYCSLLCGPANRITHCTPSVRLSVCLSNRFRSGRTNFH